MSRHTDIANGIFLLIAALFLLLYLVGSIVNNGNGKIKQQIKIPGSVVESYRVLSKASKEFEISSRRKISLIE